MQAVLSPCLFRGCVSSDLSWVCGREGLRELAGWSELMDHRSSRWGLWDGCAWVCGESSQLLLTATACVAYSASSGRGTIFLCAVTCSARPARFWLLHLFLPFPLIALSLFWPASWCVLAHLPFLTVPSAVCSEGLVSHTSVGHQPKDHESNRRGCLPAVSSNVWSLADGSSSYRGNPANLL